MRVIFLENPNFKQGKKTNFEFKNPFLDNFLTY